MQDLVLYSTATFISMIISSIVFEQVKGLKNAKAKLIVKYNKKALIIALFLTAAVSYIAILMLGNILGLSYELIQIISGIFAGIIISIAPY